MSSQTLHLKSKHTELTKMRLLLIADINYQAISVRLCMCISPYSYIPTYTDTQSKHKTCGKYGLTSTLLGEHFRK